MLWALRAVVGFIGLVSSGVLALGLARDVVTSVGDEARQAEPVVCEGVTPTDLDLPASPEVAPPTEPQAMQVIMMLREVLINRFSGLCTQSFPNLFPFYSQVTYSSTSRPTVSKDLMRRLIDVSEFMPMARSPL